LRFVGVDSPKITHPNSRPWIYSTIVFPNKRINEGHQKEKKNPQRSAHNIDYISARILIG
jgi:hypothetical protein